MGVVTAARSDFLDAPDRWGFIRKEIHRCTGFSLRSPTAHLWYGSTVVVVLAHNLVSTGRQWRQAVPSYGQAMQLGQAAVFFHLL